jgi:hypothetical protein
MMFKHSNKNFNNMKRNLLTLFAAIFAAFSLNAQFARVQAIHNAADPALATVDVYLDTILLVPNFNFQQATPYIDAPAGINFDISLTAPGAGDTVGAIFKKSFNLTSGTTNILVASGDPGGSGSTGFDLRAYAGQEVATNQGAGEISVKVIHGATDAPAVDVYESQVLQQIIVPNLSFGQDAGYLDVPATDFDFQIRPAGALNVVAQYDGNLTGLDDSAIVVLASGYLSPAPGEPAFGLIAVFQDGTVISLPSSAVSPARVQVVHNCAATDAAVVDVWLDNTVLSDDLDFRSTTAFVDAPAGVPFDVSVAGPASVDTTGALYRESGVILESNKTYIVVASGTIGSGTYNPATPFSFSVYEMGRENADNPSEVDVLVLHGSTDAPTVDVAETGVGAGTIVDNISYGEFQGYLSLAPAAYQLTIQDSSGSNDLFTYDADVTALAGNAITILASGFLDPTQNNGGEGFGLFVATAAGGPMIELPESVQATARVQAIHNCPDPIVATVDVYLDNTLLVPGFAYKTATPFIDAPATVDFDLVLTAVGQGDTTNALFRKTFNLPDSGTFVVVADGEVGGSGSTAFDLRAYGAKEEATNQGAGEASVNIIHSVYDAPAVDVYESQVLADVIASNLSFGNEAGYLNVPATDFDFQVRPAGSAIVVGQFNGDITGLDDSALIVLATGYLDPASAPGTEPFGLIAVLPDGTVIPLASMAITPARLQVIHNSAATDADTVDIWLDALNLLDNFGFREASAFVDAPAGAEFTVSVAGPNSTDTAGALYQQNFILESSKTYIAIASGVIGGGTYTPATPFSIEVITDAQEDSENASEVDVVVWHGSTDAPAVDVVETQVGAGTIVDDISYGEADGYLMLAPADYDLVIQDVATSTSLFKYDADLSALAGNAITVVASGFVDPSANNNGEGFGLWVATAAGGPMLELPSLPLSLEKLSIDSDVLLWPNPAKDQITLENRSNTRIESFEVYSITGQTAMVEYLNEGPIQNISLTSLPSGMYIFKLNTADGQIARTIIKE